MRECNTCQGNLRVKVFGCAHPAHVETTLAECATCPDYQERVTTSPQVQYQYADGSTNTTRPTALIYPNGRELNYNYGTSGGTDDALSWVASLIDSDGASHLVDYTRVGLDTIVQATYPQPNIRYDLINGSGADPYSGLDQFDRVADCRWWNITSTTDVERIKHTYDRADNRVTRENTVCRLSPQTAWEGHPTKAHRRYPQVLG